jgi:hypothetical protein
MTIWAPKDPSELEQMATTLYSTGWIELYLFDLYCIPHAWHILPAGYGNLSSPLMFILNARDENCYQKFVWCDQNSIIGPEYPWGESDPNNFLGSEACINFWLFPDKKKPVITDEVCASKKYFICEVL